MGRITETAGGSIVKKVAKDYKLYAANIRLQSAKGNYFHGRRDGVLLGEPERPSRAGAPRPADAQASTSEAISSG